MSYKAEYLPTKCWVKDGTLHRAFFEYDEDVYEHVRDFGCCLSTIVNASRYCLGGENDEKVSDIEDWLIAKTGINEDWYWKNHKRYGGIMGLVEKFKKQCVAFEFLSVYDHSGITVSCGLSSGWDYSNVGFVYVAKDNEEVKAYRKGHTLKKTTEWAMGILHDEIHTLDDYVRGNVYCLIHEVYDEELEEWEIQDTLGSIYLTSDTREEEEKYALEYITEYSGKCKLFEWDVAEDAIEHNSLDILNGQQTFNFEEIA